MTSLIVATLLSSALVCGVSNYQFLIPAIGESSNITSNNETALESDGLGNVTPEQNIAEIQRILQDLFEGNSTIAFKSLLDSVHAEFGRLAQNDFALWNILSSNIIDEEKSGPLAQAFKVLAYDRLASTPEQANRTVMELAERILAKSNADDFDKLSVIEILKAATVKIDISNITNGDAAWIAGTVAGNDSDRNNLIEILYQIGLNAHNRGGNMSKIIGVLKDDVSSEMVQAVPVESLPLTQSLLHLAKLKSAGNQSMLNSIVDSIVTGVLGNEELIGAKIKEHRSQDLANNVTSPTTA